MKRLQILFVGIIIAIFLGACSMGPMQSIKPNPKDMKNSVGERHQGMMMGHGRSNIQLKDSTGENELNIPPILEKDKTVGNDVYYTIEARQGGTEIFAGTETETFGYNGTFLGPIVKLKKGQTAHLTLKNSLEEATTFHWHGLIIKGDGDGGPHEAIEPNKEKEITFEVKQDRATLWFHPHPLGETAKQVYNGLAGLMYIEDDQEDSFTHGESDFPLIIQDRIFNEEKQLDYEMVRNLDGTSGDTLLINGTVNPRLTVNQEKVRLRLLNGSNTRNMTFKLTNNERFTQIASDGGLLNEPVQLTDIQLTPSERAEIIIDFSQFNKDEDVNLMLDDGTIVLPFHMTGQKGDTSAQFLTAETEITLDDSLLQQEIDKKIELFGMMHHVTINGKQFDMNRIDLTQKKGETEVWEIYNKRDMMGGMIHPFHIHGTQFQVISINDEIPPENLQGFKDTIAIEPGDKIKLAVTFPEAGTYMYHCHILEHEDNGMMGQIKVE